MPRESMNGGFDHVRSWYRPGSWTGTCRPRVSPGKNPDYGQRPPVADKIERPIITDYSQLLAQFRAGNI